MRREPVACVPIHEGQLRPLKPLPGVRREDPLTGREIRLRTTCKTEQGARAAPVKLLKQASKRLIRQEVNGEPQSR